MGKSRSKKKNKKKNRIKSKLLIGEKSTNKCTCPIVGCTNRISDNNEYWAEPMVKLGFAAFNKFDDSIKKYILEPLSLSPSFKYSISKIRKADSNKSKKAQLCLDTKQLCSMPFGYGCINVTWVRFCTVHDKLLRKVFWVLKNNSHINALSEQAMKTLFSLYIGATAKVAGIPDERRKMIVNNTTFND